MLLIVFAVLFIVTLFLFKTTTIFKNIGGNVNQEAGLVYSNEILGNLVNKDTDGDGVLDWEEGLWGTDPRKKDTNDDGIPDSVEIENLKKQETQNQQGEPLLQDEKNLTETDKFSREFFATVATLNQNGQIDQATVNKLSESLANNIQNSPPKKVFVISDLKVIKDDSVQAVKKYSDTLKNTNIKYQTDNTVLDILQRFIVDENTVDVRVLSELDPIIEQTNKIIGTLTKISIPQSLASLHLDFINGLQRLSENLSNIQLYDTDAIVALSAISQYDKNTTILESAVSNLEKTIQQKLNN